MNTQVAPRPPITAGGQVAALIPQNLDEAFRVAHAFHASGLAPQSLKSPEAIMVSIMAGAELGFAPYQAMQSFAVINGRASIWGDAIPALLWSKGFDIEEWFDDEDNPTKAFCKVTRPSGKEIQRTFSLKDAKLAGLIGKAGPWQTAQKRMLQMRARAFSARDGAADVLRGMPVYEEVQDYDDSFRDVTPQGSGMKARLEARAAGTAGFNPAQAAQDLSRAAEATTVYRSDTGEIIDAEVEERGPTSDQAVADDGFPGDKPAPQVGGDSRTATTQTATGPALTLTERIDAFTKRVEAAPTVEKMDAYLAAAGQLLAAVDAGDPDEVGTSATLQEWFNETRAARVEADKAAADGETGGDE